MATKPKVGQIKATKPRFEYVDIDPDQLTITNFFEEAPAPQAETAPERGKLRGIADTGLEVVSGAAKGVKFMTDVAGANNAASRGLGAVSTFVKDLQSAQAKGEDQRMGEIMKAAEDLGVWDQVKAAFSASSEAYIRHSLGAIGTGLPILAASMLPGLREAVWAKRMAAVAGMGVTQGTGIVKSSIYDSVYERAKEEGRTEEDARSMAEQQQSYLENPGLIAGGAVLGGAAAATGLTPALMRAFAGSGARAAGAGVAAPGLMRSLGTGLLKEAPLEGAQGGQEQYAGNVGQARAGFETPWQRGVAGASTMEALLSAPGGLAGGAMDYAGGKKAPMPGDAIRDAEIVPESGPMTRAANTATEIKAQQADAEVLRLGFSPLAGTPIVFPDGSVALGSEAEQAKRDQLAMESNIEREADKRAPKTAGDAYDMLAAAQERGLDYTVALHPAGGGFLVVPKQWVTPEAQEVAVGQLMETIGRMRQADAEPVQRAPRTSTTAQDLELTTDPVTNYVDDLRQVNTPAARFYVSEVDAGRITPQDVQQRMTIERGKTPDERIAEAAAEGLRMNPKGDPFKTLMSARREAKKNPGDVIQVEGGYAIRPQQEQTNDPIEITTGPAAEGRSSEVPQAGDAAQGALNEQDAPSQPAQAQVQAQAAPVEAPAPAGSNATAADGSPAATGVGDVQADGVTTDVPEAAFGDMTATDQSKNQPKIDTPEKPAQEPAKSEQGKPGDGLSGYSLPSGRTGDDWARAESPSFEPNPRQQVVMDAVAKALDSGKFYSRDVDEFVAQELKVGPAVRSIQTSNTEGGDFGYDVFNARRAVEAQRGNAKSREIASVLALKPGDKIGAIIPNDLKRITSVVVESLNDTGLIAKVSGKRGATTISGHMSVDAIKAGIERAKEKGSRKDGYGEFVAQRQQVAQPKETAVDRRNRLIAEREPAAAPAPKPKAQKPAKSAPEPRAMNFDGRPVDGKPIMPGDTFRTTSVRITSPWPTQKGERYASQWSINNAIMEAETRGDGFNLRQFQAIKPGKNGTLTPSDGAALAEYLFGEQPSVVPSILKPLTGRAGSGAALAPDAEPLLTSPTDEDSLAQQERAERDADDLAKAKAAEDLKNALGDLANIFGKDFKANMLPEQEQKLLPVLTRLMDAAFRLGYLSFKDAAKYVLDQIRAALGQPVADAITLDHMQGAYIGMAGRYKEQGAESARAVVQIEDKTEIEKHTAIVAQRQQVAQPKETAVDRRNRLIAEREPAAEFGDGTDQPLENTNKKADTAPKDTPNDSTTPGNSPALDSPMGSGLQPTGSTRPIRGARKPRAGSGRGNDADLFGSGGRLEVAPDGPEGMGDRSGPTTVQSGADGTVAVGGRRLPSANYRPKPGGLTRDGSWLETARRNIDLIDLAMAIDKEGRHATPEEQARLSRYVGFGAGEIRNKLFPVPPDYAKSQDPSRLIWTNYVGEPSWKALAERIEALPREWQKSVLQSSQYAHYTSEGIIRSVWSGIERLGFTGGKVFEPGMGIGSFVMLMPDHIAETSKYTGVEFDGPTALIARLLSPDENMLHGDFIKRTFPKNFFDVNVGNPPFSQTKILGDPAYEKFGFMLHDFFFAKGIDSVRPGGLQVFVTSKGTMDKQNDKARKYLSDRADLLGAIRLPSTAFEGNAGTSVVTDVIFLRKRLPGEAPAGQPWNSLASVQTKDGPVMVNEYYAANPHMVLGEQRISGNMDDMGRRISSNGRGGEKYTVVSYDTKPEELDARFAKAIESLPENAYSVMSQSPESIKRETAKVDFDPTIKHDGAVYLAKDGTIMRVAQGVGRPLDGDVKLSQKDKEWFADYVQLRDLVQLARQAQNTGSDWEVALKKLNKAYDKFRVKHGPINDYRVQVRKSTDEDGNVVETETRVFKNRRLYREDYDQAVLTSIEQINEAGEIVKAPFLLDRTIGKPVTRDVKSIGDALAVSLDNTGIFDIDDVARRMKMTREEAVSALDNQVYQDLSGKWLLADEYLSGNVVDKLEEAEEVARLNPDFARNVEALKKVQPEKLGPSQISAKLGASWIPAAHVNEFAKEIGAGAVTFDSKTETWQVDGANLRSGRMAGAEYGTAKRSPSELLEAALNSRSVKITAVVDKKTVTDEKATVASNEVLKKIKAKFKGWVWTDTERAAELVESYNKRFNNLAPRVFDGSHMTLPGVSLRFKLHPHQLRAILRQVQTGDTYLAHAVGAGKTIEMIAGGMEQKRLGLIKKPMYVVPNHMLEQFSNEFVELYPLANIMVADDENFSAERRKAFIAAATLNAPDAIVITHDAYQRIGVKEESIEPIRDEIISDLEIELSQTANGNDTRVRRSQLEQQIEAVGQRFDRIIAAGGKDATIKFEDMGVDFVYVDEAHAFRKLDFHTAQQIKGIDPMGSKRALDMYVKTRILQKQRPGRAMVFATGTPVTNTMGELYTIMRFFAPKALDEAGVSSFDAWARQFAEVAPALEQNAAGKYELVERFAKFDNVPELMSRVRAFMDVLTSEHLGSLVKRPDLIGGKPNLNVIEGTPALKEYMEGELSQRIATSKEWKPSPDEKGNPDPIVSIITDGRFAALDPRFFGKQLKPGEASVLTEMASKVVAGYKAYADTVYFDKEGKPEKIKGGTQIVFYNLGFGEAAKRNRGFDSRAAFTKALTDGGIPRAEIAWFDDANTDAKKEAVFKDMRSGKLKVLIGSAKKMGTGVNVQARLRALHYQDPPWYPSDVEQPHGRIIRQGNQNGEVAIEWYTTKGTYQSTMWQMVGRKQRFIDQAFTGDKNLRSMDDLGEASLFEQAAAVASGDPRALQLAGLRQDVDRLERLQAAHANEQVNVLSSLRSAQWNANSAAAEIKGLERAFKSIGERYFSFTSGTVGGAAFTKPGEFGQAIKEAFNRKAANAIMSPTSGDAIKLGDMGQGIEITMEQMLDKKSDPTGEFALSVEFGGTRTPLMYAAGLGADVDAVGLSNRFRNAVNGVETGLRQQRDRLRANETDVTRLSKKLGAPFEYQQEMLEKHAELKELEEALRLEGLTSNAMPQPVGAPFITDPAPDESSNLRQTGAPEGNDTDVEFSIADGTPPFYSAPALDWQSSPQGLVKDGKVKAGELDANGIQVEKVTLGKPENSEAIAKLDAAGYSVEDGRARADTADYGAATQAHKDAAARFSAAFGGRLAGGPDADLLDAVTPRESTKRGRSLASIAAVAKHLFNREVVFVKFKGAPKFNGAVSKSAQGFIFLNIDSQKPLMAVLGHELLHEMAKSQSSMYANLSRRLDHLIKGETEYGKRLVDQYREQGISHKGLDTREELEGDIVGDNFMDPEFWNALAQNQPGLFRRIVNFITRWLDTQVENLAGYRPFGTDEFLTDIAAAREAVADAMRQFSRAEVGAVADPMGGGVTFSAAKQDRENIQFSVAGVQQTMMDAVPRGVIERLSDMTTSQRGFNRWWHRTVGTQLHKAKTNEQFAPVYYAVQDFMKDVSRMATLAADQAPDLLPQVDSLSDVKKLLPQMGIAGNRQRKAELKQASEALFDGTLRYTRDEDGKAVLAKNDDAKGLVWTTDELTARGMSEKAIAMYQQARQAINQSLDNLLAADVYRMITAVKPEALAETKPGYDALMDRVRNAAASAKPGAAVSEVTKALTEQRARAKVRIESLKTGGNGRLDAAMASEMKIQSEEFNGIEKLIEQVNGKVERIDDLKASGYAPLMRFGQYTLDALDASGNRVYFGLYESQNAANQAARKFKSDGLTVRQGVQSQKEFELLKGVSPETAMLFAEMMGVEKNDAMQAWLQKAVAEQSALKRHIRRKGVEGFESDASRVVAAFLTSNSRAASRSLHGMRIQERVQNVRDGDVKDEAIALAEYVNNPKEEAQALRSLLFIHYIGGSVASALVNLTQTVVQTFPYLAQYGGPVKSGKRIGAAMKMALGKITDAELAAAVKRAEDDGVIKPQEVFQLQAEAGRTMGSDLRIRAGLTAWGSFFQLAEVFNRRVAFIAAYQTAKEQGIKDPFTFAENTVDETQGVFNKGNRPNWARGPVGATLFTFKTFTIQYVEFLKRLPPKEKALALGVLILLSGMRGLPFAGDAEDLIDTVAQQLGYNFTTKDQVDRFLVSTLGGDFAGFLQHGMSSIPGIPFDVSSRLGMADLLPGTGILKPSETRKEDQVLEVFGVAGGFVRDALKGEFRPIAFRNLVKGLDMYDRGIYTDTRGRKVMEVSGVDALMKGIGLQPNDVASESRKLRSQYEKRALFTKVKSSISEQIARGLFEQDQAKVKAARERLAKWNERNPEAAIVIDSQTIRRRVAEMRKDRAERFLKSAPKELRQQTLEALK